MRPNGLPIKILWRYQESPAENKQSAMVRAAADTPKLHCHPLVSCTQTNTVTANKPPEQREKKNRLKKADTSRLSEWSNWSAPCAGNDDLMPPTPVAVAYSPA